MPTAPRNTMAPRRQVSNLDDSAGWVDPQFAQLNLAHDLVYGWLQAALLEGALPHNDDCPSPIHEVPMVLCISCAIARKLCLPKLLVALWVWKIAVRAPMPKAPVYKNRDPSTGITDVGTSWALFPVQSVARQTSLTQCATNQELGLGVLALVGLHYVTRCLAYHNLRPLMSLTMSSAVKW